MLLLSYVVVLKKEYGLEPVVATIGIVRRSYRRGVRGCWDAEEFRWVEEGNFDTRLGACGEGDERLTVASWRYC